MVDNRDLSSRCMARVGRMQTLEATRRVPARDQLSLFLSVSSFWTITPLDSKCKSPL